VEKLLSKKYMLKKMAEKVCDICDKKDATPAELEAAAGIAALILRASESID
jgi:hypothetical protein